MNKKGFTLVEVLAVIGILSLLLIIAVPKINDYIKTRKKDTFITTLRNISRQIEYDNLEVKKFNKITLLDLNLQNISSNNFDLASSIAYVIEDEIYIDLVGKGNYKGMYICGANYSIKNIEVQDAPCNTNTDDLVYINFSVNLDGGSTSQIFNEQYVSESYLTLIPPTKEGYTFSKWEIESGNSTLSGNRIKFGSESTSIKAVWETNPTLTINLDGGHTTQQFEEKYEGGTNIELETPTKEGYTFIGWEVTEGNGIISGSTLTMGSSNTIIKALWTQSTFSLTIDLDGGSVSENQEGLYVIGEAVELISPTKEGYTFIGWEVTEGNGIISGNTLTMGNSDTTIQALWELNAFNLTIDLDGGSVSENQEGSYKTNETITLVSPIKEGYTFSHWELLSGGGSEILSGNTLTIGTQDANVKAIYTPIEYTISYILNDGTNASGNPTSGTYGSTKTINDPSRANYIFTGWSVSGTGAILSGTNLTIGAGNITLTANWIAFNPVESYYCANGSAGSSPYLFTYTGECEVIDEGNNNWQVRFLSDGNFNLQSKILIDVFLVGGGGAGGRGKKGYESYQIGGTHFGSGGGGGAGGYTITHKNVNLNKSTYSIDIGNGGTSSNGQGETTSAFGLIALGGQKGSDATGYTVNGYGGIGGNNGGMGASHNVVGTNPGTDGENGQGRTTREFGDLSAKLYAGGGAGGEGLSGENIIASTSGETGGGGSPRSDGTANTGGGGGGGNGKSVDDEVAGNGGSGIVIIRNARENINQDTNRIPKFTYTGMYLIVNDNDQIIGGTTDNWKIKFLSSGTLNFSDLSSASSGIDLFLVGGGGGGGNGKKGYEEGIHYGSGGGGGGAGYGNTISSVLVNLNNNYSIVVGEGGAVSGGDGGITSAFGYSANGGGGGGNATVFSVGGTGGTGSAAGGTGAKYTNKGETPSDGKIYEFNNTKSKLYAGGGAGGRGIINSTYSAEISGGAGGGGKSQMPAYYGNSGSGGGGGNGIIGDITGKQGASGIVVIRNAR